MKLTSRDNPKVRRWAKLVRDAKLRKKEGRLLIEGPHLVEAALRAGLQPHVILISERAQDDPEIAGLTAGATPVVLSERVFASVVEVETPAGIAAEVSMPSVTKKGDTVFLEGVQDPGNAGTIMRSAAAFGVACVVLDRACADAWSPKAMRAGMGAHFALQVSTIASLEEELGRFAGRILCAVPRKGADLKSADLSGRIGWLFGAEGRGVSAAAAKHADLKVSIPMAPGSESLNVAAAAAICFCEAFSRRAAGSSAP
jgi:TrmH family RNA methyltransferase